MIKRLSILIFFPFFSFAQNTLQLTKLPPDPLTITKASFHRSITSPLPLKEEGIRFGDSLLLTRYYVQQYLITDTGKAQPVWFSILMGYDETNFWLVVDMDYDGKFENEKPIIIYPPDGVHDALTGEKFFGEILRYDLASFSLNHSINHPGFPLFLQPVFSFFTEERGMDNLVMNIALVTGHKVMGDIVVQDQPLQLAIQLHALMPDFTLFEYYNPRHQQSCWINLLEDFQGPNARLIAYNNAYSFLIKREPMAVDSMRIFILPDHVDYQSHTLGVRYSPMLQTVLEDKMDACASMNAIDLTTSKSFTFPTTDSLILYFTGSWCAPCREITPKVDSFFNKLPSGWKGYVVANEKRMEDAVTYLMDYNFENMLFEPLSDRSDCSLKSLFSIGLYPSFVYLSPDGKLLWSGPRFKGL
jgi:thiol-disulfide isomerase/thioredoxin